jgi:hypothetical protein
MTVAHQRHPRLCAEFHSAQVGRGKGGRRKHRVEPSVAQVTPQRAAISLEHRQLDAIALTDETFEDGRSPVPASPCRDPQSHRANQSALQVAPGCSRGLRRRHRRSSTFEEQLSRSGQIDPTRVPLKQLYADLGLESAYLGRQPRLSHPKTLGRAGETSRLGDGHEIAKVA